MKKIIYCLLLILFIFIFKETKSQYSWIYDANGNIISGSNWELNLGKPITLYDFASQTSFVLDSSRTVISAFDKKGNLKWKINPYKDYKIREYRTKNPIIISYGFKVTDYFWERNKFFSHKIPYLYRTRLLIGICYNNSQFGSIDLNNGFYYWMGQD